MKKNFLTVGISAVTAVCLCFGLAGCDKTKDPSGDAGSGDIDPKEMATAFKGSTISDEQWLIALNALTKEDANYTVMSWKR